MKFRRTIPDLLKRRWTGAAAVAVLAALAGNAGIVAGNLGSASLGWLGHAELSLFQRRVGSGPIRPNPEVVLVAIQPDTPRRLGLDRPVLPLPRDLHAELIRGLREAGAHAVVFDLLFTSASERSEDAALHSALAESRPLHVVLAAEPDSPRREAHAPGGWRYTFQQPVVLPTPAPPNVTVASPVAFDPAGTLQGVILLRRDERRNETIPHLALAAALARFRIDPRDARWDRARSLVTAGSLAWPVGEDGELLTRWTGETEGFSGAEYSEVLRALREPEGREQFRGKIVIVGEMSGGDTHRTPLGRMAGMEFVAHTLNTLLLPSITGARRWDIPTNALWSLLLAFVAAAAVATARPWAVFQGLGGTLAAAVLVPSAAFAWGSLWIDTVGPVLSVLLAGAGAAVAGVLRQGALARRFLPAHVLQQRPETLTEVATVMFVDLRESTLISERLGPVAAQQLLAELLGRLSDGVVSHRGEVERTLGDGLLAVFRGEGSEAHAIRCLECGSTLRRIVEQTDAEWRRRHGFGASVTIGIETGVISGTVIRSAAGEEWSSFGPTVNLARRLQEQATALSASVVVGPTARALVQQFVSTRLLGVVALKGIAEPTPIYSIADGPSVDGPGGAE